MISSDINNQLIEGTDDKLFVPSEVIESAGPLTGAVPSYAKWGIDTVNSRLYYNNGGNWTPVNTNDISSGFYSETNGGVNTYHNWNGSALYNRAGITISGANLIITIPGIYFIVVEVTSNVKDNSYNGWYLDHMNPANSLRRNWTCGQNGQGNLGGNRQRGGTISCVANCVVGDYFRVYYTSSDTNSFTDRATFYIEKKA